MSGAAFHGLLELGAAIEVGLQEVHSFAHMYTPDSPYANACVQDTNAMLARGLACWTYEWKLLGSLAVNPVTSSLFAHAHTSR